MYGLFLLKTKKALRLSILLKNFLDKYSEFYNRLMKSGLQDNNIEMY